MTFGVIRFTGLIGDLRSHPDLVRRLKGRRGYDLTWRRREPPVRRSPSRERPSVPDRLGDHLVNHSAVGPLLRGLRSRVFPDHWSLLFGQIAFHSFIIVVLSGVFLMFFYEPSVAPVTYDGSYAALKGVEMSRAFDSTLDLSFEVRGGLLMRQVHHWAALLMIASIMLHLLRLFFTGGFRRPRGSIWLAVFLLLVTAMGAGFAGHSLPDDMRSGTSLAVLDGVLKATPFVGVSLSSLLFGGPFPGDVLALFYPLHVVILPAAMVVLFAAQAILALHHKPAQFPGPGRTEDNIVGRPAPILAVKGLGLFLIVFGVIVLMAATLTVNPVWTSGPADPASAPAGSGPEWYLAVFDGALRLVPAGWEFDWLGKTWTLAVLVPVAMVTIFFLLAAGYPFLERWVAGDRQRHHLLERPRSNPTRTGIGVAGIVFYGVLWAAAGSDTIALQFHLSVGSILHTLQVLLVAGPIIGYAVTKRICVGLQRRDMRTALDGFETGQIVRRPDGGYVETHHPVDAYERWRLIAFEEHPALAPRPDIHGRTSLVQRLRAQLSRFFFKGGVAPPQRGSD
jgi:ubiquinol-cytochrome c reductase cytochrome b subunit